MGIEIPGFELEDYVELLNSRDADLRYLAVANLYESKAFASGDRQFQKTLTEKVSKLLGDPDPKVRAVSAFFADPAESARFEPVLTALLHDRSSAVRADSLAALTGKSTLSDETAAAVLGRLDDRSTIVRLQAFETVAGFQKEDHKRLAATRLLSKLQERPIPEKLKIIKTLGDLGQPVAEQSLLRLLDSDDPRVVTVAAVALDGIASEEATKPLMRAIRAERGDAVALAHALASIRSEKVVGRLAALLEDKNERVREAAILGLMDNGGTGALEALVRRLHRVDQALQRALSEERPETRISLDEYVLLASATVAVALDLDGTAETEPPMAALLESSKLHEKLYGLHALESPKPFDRNVTGAVEVGPDHIPALMRLAEDPSIGVRILAIQALGNSVDRRVSARLSEEFESPFFELKRAAISAAANYAKRSGDVTALAEIYKKRESLVPRSFVNDDPHLQLRLLIDESIAELDLDSTTRKRHRAELTSEGSRATKLIAAVCLATVEDPSGLPLLLDALETGPADEKRFVLHAVTRVASEDVHPRLQKIAAAETDEEVKRALLKALGSTQ